MASFPLHSYSQGLSPLFIFVMICIGWSRLVESKPILQTVDFNECYNISKTLVHTVTETLTQLQNDLVNEFNCDYNDVDIEDVTEHEINTVTACLPAVLPKNSACQTLSKTLYDENTCLNTIYADLKAFKYELQDLNPSLNDVIKQMMQALMVHYKEEEEERKPPCSSFSCKMRQCGIILSFRLRTITVSRMLNFLKLTSQGASTKKSKSTEKILKNN